MIYARRAYSITGSSPRMRGTQTAALDGRVKSRFIPAYAGNAPAAFACVNLLAVHPRVCGERATGITTELPNCGSSPRMRGTLRISRRSLAALRFIPAYAGNAWPKGPSIRSRTVHPRVCGERTDRREIGPELDGSSPRMRGTRGDDAQSDPPRRFIPAYAGNACDHCICSFVPQVHPRVCGERSTRVKSKSPSIGSSPRMRGTQSRGGLGKRCNRFIPAYAGNALLGISRLRGRAVHPRVCGERQRDGCHLRPRHGSSPRMRGTHTDGTLDAMPVRFIPAYAGNASAPSPTASSLPVHPRVCGERAQRAGVGLRNVGSSPRMRGTHAGRGAERPKQRFIPAYAGNARGPWRGTT